MASRFHSAGRGETGIRKNWIRFLQDLFVQHPAVAPPSKSIAYGS